MVTGRAPGDGLAQGRRAPDGTGLIAIPGGFSYGDYLRSGAMAARSPVMRAVADAAGRGVPVLGVCNGFQVLTEAGLLPGALMRNAGLSFVCRAGAADGREQPEPVHRRATGKARRSPFRSPIMTAITRRTRTRSTGSKAKAGSPSAMRRASTDRRADIAGILNDAGNVLGMMPHPERAMEPAHGNIDGRRLFEGLLETVLA